jgi:LysM repeat protein
MYVNTSKPFLNGLFLLFGLILITACADKREPFAVVEEQPEVIIPEVKTVKAEIPVEEPVETVVYEPEYPETYIVQKGDTLWDISTVFLRNPWHWPEIWYKNPQVDNPHLIYPGDELAIIYVGGAKKVQLIRRGTEGEVQTTVTSSSTATTTGTTDSGMTVVKLSPRVRSEPIDSTLPTIPIQELRHLLAQPMIIGEEELDKAAYILSSRDNHLVNSIDDEIYVRKLNTSTGNGRYQIFRPDKPLHDPETGELLGYQSLFAGEAKILKGGDPATLLITNSVREILRNDKVLPIDNTNFDRDYLPTPPYTYLKGRVIALLDAVSQSGRFQTIAINLGSRDGLQTGNVLRIMRIGDVVPDYAEEDPLFTVKLPDERIGLAMVVRSFEKLSYALVMEASQPIGLKDYLESP